MPAAWGQHRLDHRQARPIDRRVACRRNPGVVQRLQDQRRPRDAGKEMLGGVAVVVVQCVSVAKARRDEAVVEFVNISRGGYRASAALSAAPGASASCFIV